MTFYSEINASTENSRALLDYIRCSLHILRSCGFSPHTAIHKMVGAQCLDDFAIDWIDAEQIIFIEMKNNFIGGAEKYDA